MFYDNDSSTSVERRPKEFLSSNFGRNQSRYGQLNRLSLRYVDFVLARPRTITAIAMEPTTVAVFSARELDALRESAPDVLVLLQTALLRIAATELANTNG